MNNFSAQSDQSAYRNPSTQDGRIRLAYFVSHPIQYQAPMLRLLAQQPDIDLTVLFGSDFSAKAYHDQGFGVQVCWDTPLLEGYKYEVLPALRDIGTENFSSPISRNVLGALKGKDGRARFDLLWVHGYASINQMQAIFLGRLLGIPVLIRAESSLADRPRGPIKLLIKRVFFALLGQLIQGALPIGTRNAAYWRFYFGESLPLFTMPYAVDNIWFQQKCSQSQEHRCELQKELGLDPSRPVILFASKLQERKLCRDLLDAFLRLSEQPDQLPLPYLVIVGDGEERRALELEVQNNGSDSVRFCGFRNQSELPRFFDLCSVFVLPSCHEPWGLIVNEVMNAARPVILSSDVGCSVDLVTNGVEGFVYPTGNVEELEIALRRVLDSPENARIMGINALERVSRWNFEEDVRGLRQAILHITRRRVPFERTMQTPSKKLRTGAH